MLLQFLSLQKPLISSSFLLNRGFISPLLHDNNLKRRRGTNSPLRAMEKEPKFELDQERAREALQKLDQQLQALSQKEITPPKKRVSSSNYVSETVRVTRDLTREEMPELSGSYLPYSAVALLFFSIFYNILFITIIKPSVDGPEPELAPATTTTATTRREAPNTAKMQQSPAPPVTSQR